MKWLKRFIVIISILFVCSTVTMISLQFYVFSTSTVCDDDFALSYLDKQERLEASSPPRIIFVGDSNLQFTLASENLAEVFPYEIINMSSKSVVGLRFDLERIKSQIQAGDIVIISGVFEQFIINRNFFNGNKHQWLWGLMVMDNNNLGYITHSQQWQRIFDENTNQLFKRIVGNRLFSPDCIYIVDNKLQRSDFNIHGDYIGHLGEESYGKDYSQSILETGQLDLDNANYLNDYAQFVHQQDALFLFAYPAYPEGYWINSKEEILDFHTYAKDTFDFPILGHPEDYWLPNELLYDTFAHGTDEGRIQRTEQLIADLTSYFENEATP